MFKSSPIQDSSVLDLYWFILKIPQRHRTDQKPYLTKITSHKVKTAALTAAKQLQHRKGPKKN